MNPLRETLPVVIAVMLALASCSSGTEPGAAPAAQAATEGSGDKGTVAPAPRTGRKPARTGPARVDPRKGGFDVTLGEWAVTPEAPAIRPGTVTFVVHNRGTMGHGFEMELEGESSGHGSGDLFKAESELVRPGESTRMTVTLPPGLYEIECLVDGHDDMGMEGVLEVKRGAPLVEVDEPRRAGRVTIAGFAFDPAVATVAAGTEVVWTNDDPADHTVTSLTGEFGSDALGTDQSFSHRFAERGTYEYRCAIHPEMTGKVKVE